MIDIIIPTLFVVAAVNLILGVIIVTRGYRQLSNAVFGLITLTAAFWSFSIIGFYSESFKDLTDWTIFTHLFAVLVASMFFYFAALFPKNTVKKRPLVFVLASLPILLVLYMLLVDRSVVSSSPNEFDYTILRGYVGYALVVIFYFFGGYWQLFNQLKDTRIRDQRISIIYVLVGSVMSSTLAIVPDLIFPYFGKFDLTWLGPIFTLILILSIFIGIIKHHLFNIKVIVTEAFVVLVIMLLLVELFLANTPTDVVVTALILCFISVFSFLIIRSVYREVEQREKIEVLAKDLAETNDRQEKLIHFIGHEVKGYLTKGEYAFAEMVDGDYGNISDQVKVLAGTALAETRKGVQAVTDILKAANLKRGTVTYDIQQTDFRDLVKEMVIKTKPIAEEKGLKFETVLDEAGQYLVRIDRTHFGEHVLRNLIDNSIKYTPTGSITVGLSRQGNKVIFSVKDTGVGITDEDKARLFTEGGRGKDSVKVNVHSTGYGLYIAKQIVEAHAGRILMESAGPGKGSTFNIELPLAK